MLSLFSKKKINEDTAANIFVNGILKLVEEGFPELAGLVNNENEFIVKPTIAEDNYDKFLVIVITGNLSYLKDQFDVNQGDRIIDKVYTKFSNALSLQKDELKSSTKNHNTLFYQLNHPSKNTKYAMSKAFFHKYELYEYQDDYFRKMRVPNPILLKKLNEAMENFVWDWEAFFKKYKVSEE